VLNVLLEVVGFNFAEVGFAFEDSFVGEVCHCADIFLVESGVEGSGTHTMLEIALLELVIGVGGTYSFSEF
jgi:hypothetical protein